MNTLQNLAVDGAKPMVKQQTVSLDGKSYSAEILQLGGALEYFVTPNNQFCGVRKPTDPPGQWRMLDPVFAPDIRMGVQVIKKEIPADLVTLQIPTEAND